MKRVLLIIGFVVVCSAGLIYLAQTTDAPASARNGLQVTATFYPLAEFAQKVGGAHVTVHNLTPAGIEPHDYEPTPRDIRTAYESDLLIANGSGLDPWISAIRSQAEEQGVSVVIVTDQIQNLLENTDEHEDEEHAADEHEEDHGETAINDPHIWLDPVRAQEIVQLIADEMSRLDPEHSSEYQKNADAYNAELASLDSIYRQEIGNSCTHREIFVSHAAFAYLADRYDIEMHSISGLSPDDEPSPRRLAELSILAKEQGIDVILFETLVSPKLAETLAREIGAETMILNPLEGLTEEELSAGVDYISVMRKNLQSLKHAMHCNE